MEALNEVMSQHQDEICNYIVKLSQELNVSNKYASAIWYLRTRSRWTQELEDKLVQMCKDNEPVPNMCDWP